MKISGKVVFHAGKIQHNQATFEGVELMADMLTGQRIRTITNCFMIPAFEGSLIGGSPIDWGWDTLRSYLTGNKLYASVVAALDNKFGTMTSIAQGRSSEDGASKIVNTVLFPAGKGTVPSTTVFYLVLIAGGNTLPYNAAGYQPTGNEVVLAVVDMTTNPIAFTPNTDNNFTWTIFITPEQGENSSNSGGTTPSSPIQPQPDPTPEPEPDPEPEPEPDPEPEQGVVLNNLEWASENLTGHGGTEVNGRWYYTYEQAVAAADEIGDGWRLPTEEEFQQLADAGSTWVYNGPDGQNGRWFGGNHDTDHEGSLFLPAEGHIIKNTTTPSYVRYDGVYIGTTPTNVMGYLSYNEYVVGAGNANSTNNISAGSLRLVRNPN